MKYHNNFISLEGGEGSGKTTVAKLLKKRLEVLGYDVILTREPGGTEVGEEIRNLILKSNIDIKTEVLLFAAGRNEHMKKVILPALLSNKIVICDRFVDSSIVYQEYVGMAKNVGKINDYVIEYHPEFVFFFDIEPQQALSRINLRDNNRFDKQNLNYHKKIYLSYKDLITKNKKMRRIDATKTPDEIVDSILQKLDL